MTYNSESDDPKAVWRGQPSDHRAMRSPEVREKIRKFEVHLRREGIVAAVLVAAALLCCFFLIVIGHPARIIAAAMGTLLLIVAYKNHRRMWPWLPPLDMASEAPASLMDCYRRDLERRRRAYAAPPWDQFLISGILVVAYIRYGGIIPIYFFFLLGVCVVLMFFARRREANKVRQELQRLDAFEN
jgi:Flp pilus assembly protein TadB